MSECACRKWPRLCTGFRFFSAEIIKKWGRCLSSVHSGCLTTSSTEGAQSLKSVKLKPLSERRLMYVSSLIVILDTVNSEPAGHPPSFVTVAIRWQYLPFLVTLFESFPAWWQLGPGRISAEHIECSTENTSFHAVQEKDGFLDRALPNPQHNGMSEN